MESTPITISSRINGPNHEKGDHFVREPFTTEWLNNLKHPEGALWAQILEVKTSQHLTLNKGGASSSVPKTMYDLGGMKEAITSEERVFDIFVSSEEGKGVSAIIRHLGPTGNITPCIVPPNSVGHEKRDRPTLAKEHLQRAVRQIIEGLLSELATKIEESKTSEKDPFVSPVSETIEKIATLFGKNFNFPKPEEGSGCCC